VYGEPKAQPRQRSFVLRGRGGLPILKDGKPIVRNYDPHTAEGWKSQIAEAAQDLAPSEPIAVPISLSINLLFARPKRLCRVSDPKGRLPHPGKPDRDNCEKAIADALKVLGFFVDDGQIYKGPIEKYYVAIGERPGAEIRMSWVDDAQTKLLARKPRREAQAAHF
jgi:Holliday junction resolvase RusA-like endonuclease